MWKTDTMTTIGGICSAVGAGLIGVPLTILTYYAQIAKNGPPAWFNGAIFYAICVGTLLAMVGHAVTGVASKGEATHDTLPQIQAATVQKQAKVMVKTANVPPTPIKAVEVVNPVPKV